ncbi:hypothetical protein G4B88_004662 [Cannabis sativa]|uniref:Uncharacterized protein n=1 Tax=Cannabis sativa TaxID=3483 RepID=A0A7J6FVZ6_CANSA|nr:hypothetical protein G4B88_004662 [Cannabis sativa]
MNKKSKQEKLMDLKLQLSLQASTKPSSWKAPKTNFHKPLNHLNLIHGFYVILNKILKSLIVVTFINQVYQIDFIPSTTNYLKQHYSIAVHINLDPLPNSSLNPFVASVSSLYVNRRKLITTEFPLLLMSLLLQLSREEDKTTALISKEPPKSMNISKKKAQLAHNQIEANQFSEDLSYSSSYFHYHHRVVENLDKHRIIKVQNNIIHTCIRRCNYSELMIEFRSGGAETFSLPSSISITFFIVGLSEGSS